MSDQIEDWLSLLKALNLATLGLSGIPVLAEDLIRIRSGLSPERVLDGVSELVKKKYIRVLYNDHAPDLIEVTRAGRKYLSKLATPSGRQ